MRALSALNKYFNADKSKRIGEFKREVDELSVEERDELGALAAAELGVSFEKAE